MVLGLGLLKKGVIGSACVAKGVFQAVAGSAVGAVGAVVNVAKSAVTKNCGEKGVELEPEPGMDVAVKNTSELVNVPAKRVVAAAAILLPLASGSPMVYLGALALAATVTLVREERKKAAEVASTPKVHLELQLEMAAEDEEAKFEAEDSMAASELALGVWEPAEMGIPCSEEVALEGLAPEVDGNEASKRSSFKRESVSERAVVVREQAMEVVYQAFSASERRSSGASSALEASGEVMGASTAMVLEEQLVESYVSEVLEVVSEETEKAKGCEAEASTAVEVQPEGCQSEIESEDWETTVLQERELNSSAELDESGEGEGVKAVEEQEGEEPKVEEEAVEVQEEEPESEEQDEQEEEEGREPKRGDDEASSAASTGIQVPANFQMPALIATGGYGKVYKQGNTAIKVMENIDREKVEREYNIMAYLGAECDNILGAWDLTLGSKMSCYKMPLCKGTSTMLLKAYQQAFGKPGLPEKWVLQILKQVAAALKACHEVGLCQFDIKPDNILLTQFPSSEQGNIAEGTVKLCDFGEAMEEADLEEVTHPIGTEYYMAPEMLALEDQEHEEPAPPIGTACDMYSLGVTMVVLLDGGQETGFPWIHENTGELMNLLGQEDPSQRITAGEFLESELLLNHPLLQ